MKHIGEMRKSDSVFFLRIVQEGGEKVLFHAPCNEIYIVCCCQGLVNQRFALTLDSALSRRYEFFTRLLNGFMLSEDYFLGYPTD